MKITCVNFLEEKFPEEFINERERFYQTLYKHKGFKDFSVMSPNTSGPLTL